MRSTKVILSLAFMVTLIALASQMSMPQSVTVVAKTELELRANEGMYYLQDKPFTGIAQMHDATGVLVEEVAFENGKREGLRKKWYGSGQLSYEAHYEKGRLQGLSRTWWKNGHLRSESYFKNGLVHGTQKQWYKSGVLFKEMNMVNGKEEGMQKAWRENGKLYTNYEARNGRIYGLKRANLCYELDNEEVQYAD